MKNRSLLHLCVALVLLTALQACTFTQQQASNEQPLSTVAQPEATIAVASTATAIPVEATATEAPPPAALPTATQEAVPIPPTQAPLATSTAADLSATQTVIAPILEELAMYGVDPQQGQVGWIQPPLSLEVDGYRSTAFDNKFPAVAAKDFVMAADITWNTEYGGSGCALAFHSDGDQPAPSQYMVIATRLSNGPVTFAVMSGGRLALGRDIFARGADPKFDANNGATNRLAVVGQGNIFTIYLNGTKLGEVNPSAPLPQLVLPEKPRKPLEGSDQATLDAYKIELAEYHKSVKALKDEYDQRVALWSKVDKDFAGELTALGAVAQSGRALCEFNNAWLWLIGTPGG